MNAIMYILKTGCQWRMLPKDFPPHNTVFYYFNKWKLEGVFEELMDTLHRMLSADLCITNYATKI